MRRNYIRILFNSCHARVALAVIAMMFLTNFGCENKGTESLGVTYHEPDIPSNLEKFLKPNVDEKAYGMLEPGKDSINLHEYYRMYHRIGWEEALSQILKNGSPSFENREDASQHVVALRTGIEAYWRGYQQAVREYEQK